MTALVLILALIQAAGSTATIQGTVLSVTNEPLPAARVELTGGAQGPVVTRTDGKGQFSFPDLASGRYRVSVKKEGYVRQEYGQNQPGDEGALIVVEGGRPVPPIVFRLQAASTIAGIVRNEEGYPVANILVQALRRSYGVRGTRILTQFSSVLTDDRGIYRLYWLDPGDYYVSVSYLPQLPTAVNANEDVPRGVYAATYFPGSGDAVSAEAVHLESGSTSAGIDFRLQRSPAVSVRGTVRSLQTQTAAEATVTMFAPEESASVARYSVQTDAKGVFAMNGVTPGTYILSAKSLSADEQIGFATIKVLDVDYLRADLVLGPGVTIKARLFGQVPPGTDLSRLQISFLPLESYIPAPAASMIQANGSIAVANVQPGNYLLRASGLPDTAYVKAAQLDQRDVLEQFVHVQYESQTSLDIQLAFDGGQLNGTVTNAAGLPLEGATVVLVPDRVRRHRPDQYRATTSGADGRFSVVGIASGEYKLFAWESVETNAWVNPDFMANYEQYGLGLSVGSNEKISGQVRAIR